MSFYDYQATERDRSCIFCQEAFEVSQSILSDPLTKCPKCGCLIKKLFPLTAGIVIKGREANQFNDIKTAKYWRDKNGVRHLVTAADGYSTSSTVNRQTVAPAEAKANRAKDRKAEKLKRMNLTTARAANWNKEQSKTAHSMGDGVVTDGN